jgi:hypothetical protein
VTTGKTWISRASLGFVPVLTSAAGCYFLRSLREMIGLGTDANGDALNALNALTRPTRTPRESLEKKSRRRLNRRAWPVRFGHVSQGSSDPVIAYDLYRTTPWDDDPDLRIVATPPFDGLLLVRITHCCTFLSARAQTLPNFYFIAINDITCMNNPGPPSFRRLT